MSHRSKRLEQLRDRVLVVPAPPGMESGTPCRLSTLKPSNEYGHVRVPRPAGVPATGGGITHEYLHRLAYAQAHGPIPHGLVIDHLCRRPNCIEPRHLRAVTQAVNARRRKPLQDEMIPGLEYICTPCQPIKEPTIESR